jgi:mannosyltransferase
MTRRIGLTLVGAITLLGAALRLYQIGTQSLWFDELLSVTISRLNLASVITSPASIDPPLYYILLHFWLNLGHDDSIVRLLSALPEIMAIPAMYALGRKLINAQVALVAAFIFALAPLQVFYAQEARMYAILILFSILSIWTYVRAVESNQKRDWALWVLTSALALYTHTFAVLLLFALDLDALVHWRMSKRPLQPVVVSNIAMGLLLVPSVVFLLQKLSWLLPALWLQRPTILQPLLTFYIFMFSYSLPFPVNMIALFILLAALVFVALAVWQILQWRGSRERANLLLLSLTMLVPPAMMLLISQWRSVYIDRLLLGSSPALYLLLAWGIVQSDRRAALRICAAVAVPLIVFSLLNYYTQPEYAKSPLRQAIQYVETHRTPGELVVHTSDSSFLAGRYYDAHGNHVLLYNSNDQWLTPMLMNDLGVPFGKDALQIISGQEHYWVVVALDHIPDEQMAEKSVLGNAGILLEETQIGGIGVYHYALKTAPGSAH